MTKCSGITQAGTACKGTPIDGSQWCYVHHPDRTEERRRHGSKGASAEAGAVPSQSWVPCARRTQISAVGCSRASCCRTWRPWLSNP
jgi:hypothetical protein